MKTAKIAYLRNHLSEVVSCVKEGEHVLILERDKPVAELKPYQAVVEGNMEAHLQDLQRKGLISLGERSKRKPLPEPVKLTAPVSAVETVLKERSEGW